MPPRRRAVTLCLLLVGLALAWGAADGAEAVQAAQTGRVAPAVADALRARGEARVVVMLDAREAAKAPLGELRREVAALRGPVVAALGDGFEEAHRFEAVPALVGTLRSAEALGALRDHPLVVRVDLDVPARGGLASSVPHIRADARHEAGTGGRGVVVAVLDSGADTDHPDLAGRVVHEACFLDTDGTIDGAGACPNGSDRQVGAGAAEDDQTQSHGTHVAGVVASAGRVAAPGVAPEAQIVAIKVIDQSNAIPFFSEVIVALDYLVANPQLGVRVVNMSLGTDPLPAPCDGFAAYTLATSRAIGTLRARGVVAFASAGNEADPSAMGAPACLREVVAVGASRLSDSVADFSNSSESLDLVAPGVSIRSSGRGGGRATLTGTSMASPHAAGCAALLLASGDATSPDEIETFLGASPVRVQDPRNGLSFPRLDCAPVTARPLFSTTFSPSSVEAGEPSTLTYTVDNGALPVTARDLAFEEALPEGMAVVEGSGASSCGGALSASAGSVSFVGGHVVAGETCTVSVEVEAQLTGTYATEASGLTSSRGVSEGEAAVLTATAPEGLALWPPSPNPTGAEVAIRYAVPEVRDVTLALFDARGREVATLASGPKQPGVHPARFSAGALAPGLYLLRLVADEEAVVRRLVVAR